MARPVAPPYDPEEIRRRLGTVPWFHRYEILPGIFTPGHQDTDACRIFDYFKAPRDLTGKTVLEVATWDGPVAFEAERRGAQVTAVDIQDPDKTGFNVARAILGSQVTYIEGSVYDLSTLVSGPFDYIVALGLFYHLKHPVLAFEQIARVLADGGLFYFEGECLRVYGEDALGRPAEEDLMRRLADSEVPLALYYADTYKRDDSNWFVPNFAGLTGWLKTAGFEVVQHGFLEESETRPPIQRVSGVARKVGGFPIEHRRVGYVE